MVGLQRTIKLSSEIASMLFAPRLCRAFALRKRILTSMSAAVVAAGVGLPADGGAVEQLLKAKASSPGGTIKLLTAPHIGKKVCDIADATALKFFKHANHGPHKYAQVEAIEGDCAGKQGYIPLRSLDPQPQND